MGQSNTIRILDGNTFVVCEDTGDIEATPSEPTGLFSIDTWFLSTWVLTVNGERLNSLSFDDLQYFESRFFLVPGMATHYVDAKLSIIRERAVGWQLLRAARPSSTTTRSRSTWKSGWTRRRTSPTCSRSRTRS